MKYIVGFIVAAISFLASIFTVYDKAVEWGARDAITEIAAGLAEEGVDVTALLSATDTAGAVEGIRTIVREIEPPSPAAPTALDGPGLAVGEPFDIQVNRVSRITSSQIPVTVRALGRSIAAVTIADEEVQINLARSAPLPNPQSHCRLVFLASSIQEGSSIYREGTATFSVDCEQ